MAVRPHTLTPATVDVSGAGWYGRPRRVRPPGTVATVGIFDVGRLLDEIGIPREFRLSVRRPDDLLLFDLLLDNLSLRTEPARLERENPGAPARLIVELPPQSFAEQAFEQVASNIKSLEGPSDRHNQPPTNEPIPPLPAALVRMSGRSRVAFTMPSDVSAVDYTLAAVLRAMRTWSPALDISAQPDPDPPNRFIKGEKEFTLGEVLSTVVASSGWRATHAALSEAAARIGGPDIAHAIEASARRVATRGAIGLLGGGRQLESVLAESMTEELELLTSRFPALRESGPGLEATTAAMALAATQTLAATASRTRVDPRVIGELGILPFLLAPHAPSRTVTALELPYRLILSPIEDARWRHADQPVVHHERTELWHTRLTTSTGDAGADAPSKVRAVWSPDYPLPDPLPSPPFRTSLDPTDRKMLVKLMAGFDEQRSDIRAPYMPRASQAKRLHLSSLGGVLEVEGGWKPQPENVDIEEWRHVASLGRDHYVRVVYAGFLCHFGHAASLVKVTERKVEGNANQRIAVLRQHYFIVVRERFKHYTGANHSFQGRNFPFTDVEIVTRVTPDLFTPGIGESELKPKPPDTIVGGPVYPRMAFWPMIPGPGGSPRDFSFDVIATDLTGRRVAFSMPLLFISKVANDNKWAEILRAYNLPATQSRRTTDLGGATVCFAPFDPADKGDSRLPTQSITFSAGDLVRRDAPGFYPEVEGARVGIKPVQKLLGRDAVVNVRYPEAFKLHGFDPAANIGQVFLQLDGEVHRLEFGGGADKAKSDALGALAAPQMSILGLSKLMGPVAAAEPTSLSPAHIESALKNVIQDNRFDPSDFFKDATILGGVKLADVLASVTGLAGDDVPKLVSLDLPDHVEASFAWDTPIAHPDPHNLLLPNADPARAETRLFMHGLVNTPIGKPEDATYEAIARLNNFKVNLFGFIIIWFENLTFTAHKGRKPDVAVDLRNGENAVQFGGPLEFVNELRQFIPSNGFSDPPALSVTPSGISAGYSLNLPTISVGVFSLSNASLGATFNLPFDSRPASVGFRFSERQHPFSLIVSLLGGGGFFGIAVSAAGVQEIEAALEFGAAVSIDLGVASGGVEVKAGVYFHWLEPALNKGSVTLAGYVRIYGELSVLGMISVSLTFNLELGYTKEGGQAKVFGEATLVVEIDILFFSASVQVRCHREFQGSSLDPKFKALIPDQETWAEYCDAFAEEAA